MAQAKHPKRRSPITKGKIVAQTYPIATIPWTASGPGWANSGWIVITEYVYTDGSSKVEKRYVHEDGSDVEAIKLIELRQIAQTAMNAADRALRKPHEQGDYDEWDRAQSAS
jgi:hypothetical protein